MAVACDPQSLINAAQCLNCGIPPGMQNSVLIYLLCQVANQTGSSSAVSYFTQGTASNSYVGGLQTNAGLISSYSIDIQTVRANNTQTASGTAGSIAIGRNNTASGNYANAQGYNNKATSTSSVSFGNSNTVSGTNGVGIGRLNTVTGVNAIGIGFGNNPVQGYSVALGQNNNGTGSSYSLLLGYNNTTSGYNIVAAGQNNTANANNSVVLGNTNTASGAYAILIGYSNSNAPQDTILIGQSNSCSSSQYSVAIGYQNTVSNGNYQHAIGRQCSCTNASGQCFAFGISCTVSNFAGVAIGNNCSTSGGTNNFAFGALSASSCSGGYGTGLGYKGISSGTKGANAFGFTVTASGTYSLAVGANGTASGSYSSAIGWKAQSRVSTTTNICGPIINRKDNSEAPSNANKFVFWGGVEVVLMSELVNFKTTQTNEIDMPSSCHFYPNECGIIANSVTSATVQPTVSFGVSGSNASLLAATLITGLTSNYSRYRATTLLSPNGVTTLTGTVTVAATATTLQGRYYFKGMLVEDN